MTKPAREQFINYLTETLAVPYEAASRFDIYHDLLISWQNKINLIADTNDIWIRHFLDSAQMAPLIKNKSAAIVDIGSGAGFPALPLAMLGYQNICMVESDRKKCIFLKEALRLTSSSALVENMRIESLEKKSFDFVTARACARLEKLLEYAFPLVSHGTACLFLKGKNYNSEISDAKKNWIFNYEVIRSITSDEGVILLITNLTR